MGMFSDLMGKIFAHSPASTKQATVASSAPTAAPGSAPEVAAATPTDTVPAAGSSTAPVGGVAPTPTPSTPTAPAQAVDVAAILNGLAEKSSEKLDWKRSIVDMLKLLGMDSSLTARKELASDLAYSGDESDSAAMNEWLHKEVLKKLAANGGKVPAELLG